MESATTGQVTRSAADIYEEFFVSCLFGEWPPRLIAAASVTDGDRVLDVACGTGVLARAAADTVGPSGSVIGVDINPGMLAVAARVAPTVDWREAPAEALPFDDSHFDVVMSQFGLMFFTDRTKALAEMWRVLRPGGRLAVAVWDALEKTPGYAAMVDLLADLFDDETADALRSPYNLGDRDELAALADGAGVPGARIDTVDGMARFPSIDDWVHVDVRGWTLADKIDDADYERLRAAANDRLSGFGAADGTIAFPHGAHILTAVKS